MENNLENYLLEIISGQKKGLVSTVIRFFLLLLEIFYFFVIQIRYFIYNTGIVQSKKLSCKVTSIGNITTGGTGKTPLVKFLAEACKKRGLSTVIISRGYKAKGDQARVIFDGEKLLVSEEEAGDEAMMLSRHLAGVPIITGKDRYSAGKLAVEEYKPDIIFLDDGFQYWQLARDMDIVLIDATNPFGYKHLLPRGLLREPIKALKRADLFLITRVNGIGEGKLEEINRTLKEYNSTAAVFKAKYEYKAIKLYQRDSELKILPADFLAGKRVLAFSGIGNPDSFQKSLEECGGEVLYHYIYPDHYQYTGKDIEEMASWSTTGPRTRSKDFPVEKVDMIITTAKDLVRLNKEMLSLLIAEYNLAVLEIEIKIDKEEEFLDTYLN